MGKQSNGHPELNIRMAHALADALLADTVCPEQCVNCLLGQTANVVSMVILEGVTPDEWEKALDEINRHVKKVFKAKKQGLSCSVRSTD